MKAREFVPGRKWRTTRRVTQALALIAMFVGPILGGWQRAERSVINAWKMKGWDLPEWLVDRLPVVEGTTVYEATKLVGGGGAVDYFSLGIADPVSGAVAMMQFESSAMAVVAWLIPIGLAIVFGRIFCGWFCPFGVLSRALDRGLSLLPFKFRGFDIPKRRPVRWVVLAIAIVGGALGGEWFAYAFLPHVLFQEAVYAVLLLGGIGAIGGAFLGLVVVGALFGPTLYCASICPTGAVLGALGRKKQLHLEVVDTSLCGVCTLCHRACWLGLEPTTETSDPTVSNGPGLDCDSCGRCVTACPKDNMVIRIGKAAAVCLLVVFTAFPADGFAQDWTHKPDLVLAGYRETNDFTVSVSIVDRTGMQFTYDTAPDFGSEISVYVVRGKKAATDRDGHRGLDGDVHHGALVVRTVRGETIDTLEFDKPGAPISAPRRTIFRRVVPYQFEPGDRIEIEPVPGIFDETMTWTIPEVHPARNGRFGWYFVASLFLFGGLVTLGIGFGSEEKT